MNEHKYCRFCGTSNLLKAAFCANCGKSFPSQSPQHIADEKPPYLEDEILNKVRGLVLPLTGKKILVGGVVIMLLIVFAGIAGGWSGPSNGPATPIPTLTPTVSVETPSPTPAPTAKATVKATPTATPTTTETPTATPAPTATPTLSSFYGLLVEHPASVSGDDQSGKINEERTSIHQLAEPFHRATIDGRDVYIGKIVTDSGQTQKIYLFPLGTYDEARAAQAAYVKQFEAKGFTKVDEQTSNVNERSFVDPQYPTSSGTIGIAALSPLYYNVGYTMSVSIPQATS
jgi:hypothetical protein